MISEHQALSLAWREDKQQPVRWVKAIPFGVQSFGELVSRSQDHN